MIAVITIEGILKADNQDGIIGEGTRLYYALSEHYRIILTSEEGDPRKLEHWLKSNGFNEHSQVLIGEAVPILNKLRSGGTALSLFLSPNPDTIRRAMQAGIASILFLHPRYSHPSFRPDWDGLPRPWDELVDEVEKQNIMKAEDKRRIPNE